MKSSDKRTPASGKTGPAPFSPLRFNEALLDSRQALALYKFARLFFPQLGLGLLTLLLDMENQSRRVIAAVRPEERRQLMDDLAGVVVEMQYRIKDQNRELLSLPITLRPAELLKQAAPGAPASDWKQQQKIVNRLIITLVENELQSRIKRFLEAGLKTIAARPRLPALFRDLIQRGVVSRDGRLAKDATIMDLISGRYARLFRDTIPEDIFNEYRLMRQTFEVCWEGNRREAQSARALARAAGRTRRLLAVTLETARKNNYKSKGVP